MPPTLIKSKFVDAATLFLQDTSTKITPEAYDLAIDSALETYGADKPLILSKDVVGNATSDLALSSLTNLDDRYLIDDNYGLKIEYPIIATGYPTPLYRESWIYYVKPTGKFVRLLGATPTALESVRFTYRARYVIDDATAANTTVWPADFYAFCKLVAAECCEILARLFTQTVETFPQANLAVFGSKGDSYESRAKTLRAQYKEHIKGAMGGPTTIQLVGAGVESANTGDWPLDDYFA